MARAQRRASPAASRTRRRTRAAPANTAFIDVPYDHEYEDLYVAFIAGLSGFGFIPHATVEIPTSARRLERILRLLRRCRYSFHDLSRVELDRHTPPTPRFNMPFELGLAVATTHLQRRRHEWFVFETRPHRLQKSLSDLGGTDPHVHRGSARGLLRGLSNSLVRRRQRPTIRQLEAIHRDLRRAAQIIRTNLGTDTLFEARPFAELVVAARLSAQNRLPSLRRAQRRRR